MHGRTRAERGAGDTITIVMRPPCRPRFIHGNIGGCLRSYLEALYSLKMLLFPLWTAAVFTGPARRCFQGATNQSQRVYNKPVNLALRSMNTVSTSQSRRSPLHPMNAPQTHPKLEQETARSHTLRSTPTMRNRFDEHHSCFYFGERTNLVWGPHRRVGHTSNFLRNGASHYDDNRDTFTHSASRRLPSLVIPAVRQ